MGNDEFVVFYAWQSDSPSRGNRNLIEKSLDAALKNLGRSGSIEASPRLDKDTQGVPGIPEIANTILDKIRSADAFVADVSFVASLEDAGGAIAKRIPNPNVMIELGYALSELGWERIVLVLNTATGSPDDLPFDLKNRRWPIAYEVKPEAGDDERSTAKVKLVKQLHDATEPIAKLPLREKRGTVEQRLSALEAMVSTLSGFSAQQSTLSNLIAGLQHSPAKLLERPDQTKEKCQQNLESLIQRVVGGKFHNVVYQQGMLVVSIQPKTAPTSAPFNSNDEGRLQLGLKPLGASGWDHRVFGDRFATFSGPINGDHDAATEILNDGTVNAAGHKILAIMPEFFRFGNLTSPVDTVPIPSVAFEKDIIEAMAGYLKCLKALGTAGPWYVALAVINVKRSILYVNQRFAFGGRAFEGEEIRPPVLEIPADADLENRQVTARALRPAFDYIWREHNYPRSLNYAETGDWVGQ